MDWSALSGRRSLEYCCLLPLNQNPANSVAIKLVLQLAEMRREKTIKPVMSKESYGDLRERSKYA